MARYRAGKACDVNVPAHLHTQFVKAGAEFTVADDTVPSIEWTPFLTIAGPFAVATRHRWQIGSRFDRVSMSRSTRCVNSLKLSWSKV